MRYLKHYDSDKSEINEKFYGDEKSVADELKSDLDRLVKQKIAVPNFSSTNGPTEKEKNLEELLRGLSDIVSRYADITETGEFIPKQLNEIQ